MALHSLTLSLPSTSSLSRKPSSSPSPSASTSPYPSICCRYWQFSSRSSLPLTQFIPIRLTPGVAWNHRSKSHVVRMAPDEEKMTRRSPLDFPIEWERPKPGRRPDIFPQFSPMKTPLPPPLPADPPEEDEEEEEKKEEEEEDPEKEESDKPEKQ